MTYEPDSPLAEVLAAIGYARPASRAETIKAVWERMIRSGWVPDGLEGGPGPLITVGDIAFEKIAYGDNLVVEAEGVVVCRLIG